MFRKLLFILICNLAFYSLPEPAQAQDLKPIDPIQKSDRILILAPHPDDETIGCAGIIQQALNVGASVKIAYLTNGDHNQIAFIVYEKRLTLKKQEFIHMGNVRKAEAIKAMKLLGLNERNLVFLGYPDFGTFTIFSRYWQTKRPYKSFLTRIKAVPYEENLSFQAPYVGESILNDLERVILEYRPNKIFVSHPLDTNVDHRSFYLFLQIALSDLNKQLIVPKVYPYLVHCVGWPLPRHYHPELNLDPPRQFQNTQVNWLKSELTQRQLDKKYKAVLCYKSQTESSAFYLLSFVRKNELFGDYPEIELKKQMSLKEKAVSFFGFSNMYPESPVESSESPGNLIENKGQVSYAVEDEAVLIRIETAKKIFPRSHFQLYLFGCSDKTPFAQMPKIRIIIRHNKVKAFDKKLRIDSSGITLESNSNVLIIKVPLNIVGNPDFILTSIKAYGEILPADATGYRKIDIK